MRISVYNACPIRHPVGVILFKLIGIAAGYYFFGWWGVFLGFILGAFIDRVRVYGSASLNPLKHAIRQAVFLETVFILMGRLAKADGRVSEEEIAHAEQFMSKLGMTNDHRQTAITWFKRGADPEHDIEQTYSKFLKHCGQIKNLKEVMLVYLIVMAMADGHFHDEEEKMLADIAARLGFGPNAFKHLVDMVLNQSHFAGGKVTTEASLDDAYKALGVTKDSSDAEVKRAYRKLMSQYHPDKLMGQGVPEDMIQMATEQAKDIQLAYDLIKKTRDL